MATNYPTSLDTLTNPVGTDELDDVDHAAQHANANDAIEALQVKVGIDGSETMVLVAGDTMTGLLQFSGTDHAGLRLINLTEAQRDAIAAPAAGMIVYNTTSGAANIYTTSWGAFGGGLSNVVEDTAPKLGGQLDVNGNSLGDGTDELLSFSETGSAVNEFTIANAAAGGNPTLSATGDDTDIGINLTPKGNDDVFITAGSIEITNNEGIKVDDTVGTAHTIAIMDSGNNALYRHNHASGSAYFGILNGSGTGHAYIQTQGKNRLLVDQAGGVLLGDNVSADSAGRLQLQPTASQIGIIVTLNATPGSGLVIEDSGGTDLFVVDSTGAVTTGTWSGTAIEGTAIASTGEAGGTKFLREDGDGTCSWQAVAGGGDVTKVGTPADSQIGVWTGDGTIEGDADFTFDTSSNTFSLAPVAGTSIMSVGGVNILVDSPRGTMTLSNIDALDATTETTIEAAIDTLANLTSAAALATVGTITTGTWQGTTIAVDQGGTGQTSYVNGELLIGNTTGNTLTKATLTEGEGIDITNGGGSITILCEDASDTNKGISELSTVAEIDLGTDTGRTITPKGLNDSIHGAHYVTLYVIDFSTAITTGDGKAYWRVPDQLNGMDLIDAHAQLGAAQSTSGTPTVQIARLRFATAGGARTATDMLSTLITIDANEWDSGDAATAPVIKSDGSEAVQTKDLIRIDVDVAGTGAQGLFVTLGFRIP